MHQKIFFFRINQSRAIISTNLESFTHTSSIGQRNASHLPLRAQIHLYTDDSLDLFKRTCSNGRETRARTSLISLLTKASACV